MSNDQFEQALADISAGHGAESGHLAGLSHLLPEQVARFRPVWENLLESEKLDLVEALFRAEMDSLRLEFNEVYHLAMLDASADVRRRAIDAIIEDTSPWLLNHLLAAIVEDDTPEVRAAAVEALEPIAQRAELGELPADDARRVREALLETLHRPGERIDVRAAALAAAGYFSGEIVRRELEAGYGDEELRLQAIRGMGHNADSAWLDRVLAQFEVPDDALRQVAAAAAGEIGDAAAVEGLTDLLDDPAIEVRLSAIAALGEIGGEEAREALIYAMEDKRESIRAAAAAAIEELDFFEDPLST